MMMDDGQFKRAFTCAPALKLEASEQLTNLRFGNLEHRISEIEKRLDRMEKRLWLTVYGVVALILAQTVQQLLQPIL